MKYFVVSELKWNDLPGSDSPGFKNGDERCIIIIRIPASTGETTEVICTALRNMCS